MYPTSGNRSVVTTVKEGRDAATREGVLSEIVAPVVVHIDCIEADQFWSQYNWRCFKGRGDFADDIDMSSVIPYYKGDEMLSELYRLVNVSERYRLGRNHRVFPNVRLVKLAWTVAGGLLQVKDGQEDHQWHYCKFLDQLMEQVAEGCAIETYCGPDEFSRLDAHYFVDVTPKSELSQYGIF